MLTCALILFACAASVVGVLHQPWRATLWIGGCSVTALLAVLLCAHELKTVVGGRWHTRNRKVEVVLMALEQQGGSGSDRARTGRFVVRVSSSEASGPSGAGSLAASSARKPRRASGIRLSTPRGYRSSDRSS